MTRLNTLRAARHLLAPGPQLPVYLLMFVTNRCAASCDHCFYWRELNTKVKQELTSLTAEKQLTPSLVVRTTTASPVETLPITSPETQVTTP